MFLVTMYFKMVAAFQECMCRLQNITMRDYQESVTTGQTHAQTDARQSDPYVPLCLVVDTSENNIY